MRARIRKDSLVMLGLFCICLEANIFLLKDSDFL